MPRPEQEKRRNHLNRIKESLEAHTLPEETADDEPALPPPFAAVSPGEKERARLSLIEHKIQQAMINGAFDNLPGQGKPQNLDENPYADSGQTLAFGLLKNNNLAPEWIERDKEIRRELAEARQQLRRTWLAHQERPNPARWQAALARFAQQIEKLNRKIDSLNIIVPASSLQRSRLHLDAQIQRAQDGGVE